MILYNQRRRHPQQSSPHHQDIGESNGTAIEGSESEREDSSSNDAEYEETEDAADDEDDDSTQKTVSDSYP